MSQIISLFDIIGPVMIGPSSSHTLGAAKIGKAAHQLLNQEPTWIRIQLFNSFADTGKGHKTDKAILGGTIGLDPGDEKLKFSPELANQKGIDWQIEDDCHNLDYHPNTALIKMRSTDEEIFLIGYSVGGGRIEIAQLEHFNFQTRQNLSEPIFFKPYQGKNISPETYESLENLKQQATSPQQLIDLVKNKQLDEFSLNETQFWQTVDQFWQAMKLAAENSISSQELSDEKLSGGDAFKIFQHRPKIMSSLNYECLMYGMGIAESNAKMGRVVACPTAGSCGIVPGILVALQKHYHFSDHQIRSALVIAGTIGLVVARQIELAGAVAGCQAEIGVAGAMAAAAGTYLLDGDLTQIESSASMVLGNLLGLTCDPVFGLVEIPCVNRNAAVISLAVGAIEMALAGVIYKIPFDEVVSTMKEVGQSMDHKYKETSQGGLAKTPTICRLCNRCN